MAWKYEKGNWLEISSLLSEDEEEFNHEEGNSLYKSIGSIGDPNIIYSLSIYVSEKNQQKYLVLFSIGVTEIEVYIDSIPDLMDWLARYSPFFMLRTNERTIRWRK